MTGVTKRKISNLAHHCSKKTAFTNSAKYKNSSSANSET